MASVTDIIASAQSYANGIAAQVQNAALTVYSAAAVVPNFPSNYVFLPPIIDQVSAAIATISGTPPVAPTTNTFSALAPAVPTITVPAVASVTVPTFTEVAPVLTLPAAPTPFTGQMPNAPDIVAPVAPDAPTYAFPAAPSLTAITLPDKPTFQMPTQYAVSPQFALTAPANTFAWAEADMQDTLKDDLKAKLINDIQNGGYGIEVSDELLIWDRMRSRELDTGNARIQEVARIAATRGFVMPPGSMFKAIERAIQDTQDAVNTAGREIAIKRADLFVQNRQFTIQQAQQFVTTLINFYAGRMERMLNAAKYTADATINYFNANVERVKILLQQYQTEADVWVKLIEGEKAKAEIYRLQIEGERVKGELDSRRVEIYRAQLQGIQTLTDIYRNRVLTMQTFAEVEKLKIESFRAKVDAVMGTIKAKELEFQVFAAGVQGQKALQEAFQTKVQSFGEQVKAAETTARIVTEQNNAQIANAEVQLKIYDAGLHKYEIDIDAFYKRENLKLQAFAQSVSAYSARGSLAGEVARLKIQNDQTGYNAQIGFLQYNLGQARLQLDNIISSRQVKTQAAESVADGLNKTAMAALSGVNAIASQTVTE